MLIPMIIPILYILKNKRESIPEIIIMTLTMIFIIISYWPLTIGLKSIGNIIPKFILFVKNFGGNLFTTL